ncbi:MAG TPA: hypothetical protein VFH36_16750 [Acidimicrobiales bacterium]|nr:hypothetical protein [Acidimicrobiales bacterium]
MLGGGELPLLGPSASSSWSSGIYQNHPGPLFYDILAVPAALFPGATGQIVGTVLLEALAVLGIFVLARRRGGTPLSLVAMAMTAVLCWSMGSAVLVEPWPPNTLLLPVVCFLLLAWSVSDGDVACLPWLVGVGSLVLQSNMSYGVLVPVLAIYALVGLVQRGRRDELASWRRIGWVTVAVAVVLWIQPLVEQVAGTGEGNMSRIVRGLGEGTMTLNWRSSLQVVAKVLSLPPWWARPSYAEDFRFGLTGNPLPSLGLALLSLGAVAGLLLWCRRRARRDGDASSAGVLTMAAVLVVAAVITANQTPTTQQGTVAYQLRWLWPVALFVWLAVASVWLRWADRRGLASRPLAVVLAVVTATVAILNLSWTNQGTTAAEATMPVARDVVRAMDVPELDGPVLVETDEGIWDPYSEAVLFELQHQGVDFVIDDQIGYRMLGEGRRWGGESAVALVRVSAGDWAMLPRPGAQVLARHPGLDQEAHDEMYLLQQEIKEAFADGELRLNDRGRHVSERGGFESVPEGDPDRVDPDTVTEARFWPHGQHRRDVLLMIRADLLDTPDDWADRLERYADLQETWDAQTVAVFLEPISAADGT